MITILVFIGSIIAGYSFSNYIIVEKAKQWHKIGLIKGYHIHHSLYGVVAILLAIFLFRKTMQTTLLGIGLGIIIEHTKHICGFIFIEKA